MEPRTGLHKWLHGALNHGVLNHSHLYHYSIKTLATFLKFKWRDKEPSGAASIEWYHRWVESGDSAIRQRILDYNEDDCIAMRVLLDAVQNLPIAN